MRALEFSMSDAYSFDATEEGMRATYERMIAMYRRIFERLGLGEVLCVQADNGPIGGDGSAEFVAVTDGGEDAFLSCPACGHAASVERSDSRLPPAAPRSIAPDEVKARRVQTPGARSVAELCAALGSHPSHVVKTMVFVDPESDYAGLTAVCVRGDLDVDVARLRAAVGHVLTPASPELVRRLTGAEVGSLGPIGLQGVDRVLFDTSVREMRDFACGANRTGEHLLDVRNGRDVPVPRAFVNAYAAADGHGCPRCPGTLALRHGVELGHVFQLQQRYTSAMQVSFRDSGGAKSVPWMGCYGIGTTRVMQAIADLHGDERGMSWPPSIAPYLAHVVVTEPGSEAAARVLDGVLDRLGRNGVDALVDERAAGPGPQARRRRPHRVPGVRDRRPRRQRRRARGPPAQERRKSAACSRGGGRTDPGHRDVGARVRCGAPERRTVAHRRGSDAPPTRAPRAVASASASSVRRRLRGRRSLR